MQRSFQAEGTDGAKSQSMQRPSENAGCVYRVLFYGGGLGDKTERYFGSQRQRAQRMCLGSQFHPVGSVAGLVLGEGRIF